jgi:hypothetical protein
MAQVPETFRSGQTEEIPSYLALAILGLLCCFPLSLVGIFFGIQVNNLKTRGDLTGARRASDRARFWTIAALGIGIILYLISIIVTLVSFSTGASMQ